MLFKTGRYYRMQGDLAQTLDFGTLESALMQRRARPCESQEMVHLGFCAPYGKGEDAPLVHIVNTDCALLCVRTDERLLPNVVINGFLNAKVEKIEEAENRRVRRKERSQLKEEIEQTLLPQAFPFSTSAYLLIDKKAGLVYCNTTTATKAEGMLSLIREVLGSFPVRPLTTKIAPTGCMTDWVKKCTAPEGFILLGNCHLKDTDEVGGAIRAKNQDLSNEALLQLIDAGKVVTELRLAYGDNLSFTLDHDNILKDISYEDVFAEKARADAGDDAEGLFDANLTLMILTMREMLPKLLVSLGGEYTPEAAA